MADRRQSRGAIVVISGPSGAGKTTILKRVLSEDPDLVWSVSATTRPPRAGEVDGRDYWFLTREEFERRIKAGEFAEYAKSFGNLYGTQAGPLRRALESGAVIVLDIDVQGAREIRKNFPDAVLVFIQPPSIEALAERLRKRRTETEAQFEIRLERARRELDCAHEYDHTIVNDDLDEAVSQMRGLLRKIKQQCQERG